MGAQIHYRGRIGFDQPIPASAVRDELYELQRLTHLFTLTFRLTDSGHELTGLVADDSHPAGHLGEWRHALHLLGDIAHRKGRSLTAQATWASDPGPFTGALVLDAAGRFHDVPDDEPAEPHRQARCDCYPPTACAHCGDTGFLARDEDAPSLPALCVNCHEQLGTRQAANGHCCRDGCTLPTSHDGLCLP
ncbi:hypothetical protein ACIG3E_32740 [Streptomyces sp. NPDC053474]|uniref:hypothetical protein n=1 Tax=Streptomyces sp. NPDC053474 TaxID=3365704 RepID=UPI0037D476BF